MSSSITVQSHTRRLAEIDLAIRTLQMEREDVAAKLVSASLAEKNEAQLGAQLKAAALEESRLLAEMAESWRVEIRAKDQQWIDDNKASPRDWSRLLKSFTSVDEWAQKVNIPGISGTDSWPGTHERNINLTFYSELPERIDVYAQFLESIFPAMKPWPSGGR